MILDNQISRKISSRSDIERSVASYGYKQPFSGFYADPFRQHVKALAPDR
jgi:hypothetical protein